MSRKRRPIRRGGPVPSLTFSEGPLRPKPDRRSIVNPRCLLRACCATESESPPYVIGLITTVGHDEIARARRIGQMMTNAARSAKQGGRCRLGRLGFQESYAVQMLNHQINLGVVAVPIVRHSSGSWVTGSATGSTPDSVNYSDRPAAVSGGVPTCGFGSLQSPVLKARG